MTNSPKSEIQSIEESMNLNGLKKNERGSMIKQKTNSQMIYNRFVKESQRIKEKRQFRDYFKAICRLIYDLQEYNFEIDLAIFKQMIYVIKKILISYQCRIRKQSGQSRTINMERINELIELQNMIFNFDYFYIKVYLDKCVNNEKKIQIISQSALEWTHLDTDFYFMKNSNLLLVFEHVIRYKINQQKQQTDIESSRYYDEQDDNKIRRMANNFFKEYVLRTQANPKFDLDVEYELEKFIKMFLEQMLINAQIIKKDNLKLAFYYLNVAYRTARKFEYQGNLKIISKCLKIKLAYAAFFIELRQYKDAIRILLQTLQLQQYEFQKISYGYNKNTSNFQKILTQKVKKIVATMINLIICYVKIQEFQKVHELLMLQQFLVENFISSKDEISKLHRKIYDYTVGLKNLGQTILIISELEWLTKQALSHDDYLEILGQKIEQKKKENQKIEQSRFDNKHQTNTDYLKNLSENIYVVHKQQSGNNNNQKNDSSQYYSQNQSKQFKQLNKKEDVLVNNEMKQKNRNMQRMMSIEEFKKDIQKEYDNKSYVSLDKHGKSTSNLSKVDKSTTFKSGQAKYRSKEINECDFYDKEQENERYFEYILNNEQEESFDFDQDLAFAQKSSLLSINDVKKQIEQKKKIKNYKLSRREFQINQQGDYKPRLIANPWFFDNFVESEEKKLNKYVYSDIHMSVSQRRLIKLQAQQQQLQQIRKLKNLSEEERKEVQLKQQQQQFKQQQLKKYMNCFNENERSFQGLDQQMKQFISEQEKVYQYVDLDEVDYKYDEIADEQYKNGKEFNYCKKIVKFKSKEGIKTNPKIVYQLPHKRHKVVTDQIIRKNRIQKQLNDQLISKGIKDGENVEKNDNLMRIDASNKQQKKAKSLKEIVMKNQEIFNSYNFTMQYKNQSEEFKRKQNSWILKTHILKNSLSPARINQLSQQRKLELKNQSFQKSNKINAIVFDNLKVEMIKRDQKEAAPDSSRMFKKELIQNYHDLWTTVKRT